MYIALAKQKFGEVLKQVDKKHTADVIEGIDKIRHNTIEFSKIKAIQSIPDSAFDNIGLPVHKPYSLFFAGDICAVALGIPLDTNNDPAMVDLVADSEVNGSKIPIYHDYIAVVYNTIDKKVATGIRTSFNGYNGVIRKYEGITEEDLRDALYWK